MPAICLFAACCGCQPAEPIHSYSIPKEVEKPAAHDEATQAGPAAADLPAGRMLGAIVLRPTKGWFFKLLGPADAVAAHADEFAAFLKTVKFEADSSPHWQAPAGWEEGPPNKMRVATLLVPAEPKPLELTISTLPRGDEDESDYVLKNLNRWRGQLQLPPIDKEQLPGEMKSIELDGATASMVDLAGKLAPSGMGRPPFAPGAGDGK